MPVRTRADPHCNPAPVFRKRQITRRPPRPIAPAPAPSYVPPRAESPEYSPSFPMHQLPRTPDSERMDYASTPSSLSSVDPAAYSGIDTSKIGVKPPANSVPKSLADLLGDPHAEAYKKYPANVSSCPSRPPPDDDGYKTVYVFKQHMPLTFAGRPIVFPSPVFVGREHPDGIHLFETSEMSLLIFVPKHWNDVDAEDKD
jgi:hypothetical protein